MLALKCNLNVVCFNSNDKINSSDNSVNQPSSGNRGRPAMFAGPINALPPRVSFQPMDISDELDSKVELFIPKIFSIIDVLQ